MISKEAFRDRKVFLGQKVRDLSLLSKTKLQVQCGEFAKLSRPLIKLNVKYVEHKDFRNRERLLYLGNWISVNVLHDTDSADLRDIPGGAFP